MVDVVGSSVPQASPSGTTRSFDVSNEHDILGLLHFVRRGPFPDGEKSTLRDAILDYATDRKPETLSSIAAAVSDAGVLITNAGAPVETAKTTSTQNHSQHAQESPEAQNVGRQSTSIGSTRPQPTFGSSEPTRDTSPHVHSVPINKQQPAPAPVPQPQPATPAESPAPAPAAPEATTPPQTDAVPSAPPQTPPPAAQPEEVASEATPEPVATPAPEPTPEPLPQTPPPVQEPAPTPSDPLSRIKEIKRSINQLVGNPVNLLDANNTVGREYMNALLNAMRVVGGDNREDTSLAMDRLEKAFETVQQSIQSGETVIGGSSRGESGSGAQKADTLPPSQRTPEPAPAPQTQTPPSQTTPAETAPQQSAPPVQPEPQPVPQKAEQPVDPAPQAPQQPAPETAVPQPAPAPAPAAQHTAVHDIVEKAPQQSAQPQPQTNAVSPQPEPAQSIAAKLAAENASRESLLHKRAQELEMQQSAEASDPLHSNEVSAGLQQLLSEWKLFKSSGFLGTGPGGYEHPLYKKLSAMPIAAVIAGRFEGATPEIKQSISDYMNGWRYEQGIVHEMNETFEHYLRRVVKEILEKQNAPKA